MTLEKRCAPGLDPPASHPFEPLLTPSLQLQTPALCLPHPPRASSDSSQCSSITCILLWKENQPSPRHPAPPDLSLHDPDDSRSYGSAGNDAQPPP